MRKLLLACTMIPVWTLPAGAQDWSYETLTAPDDVPLIVAETGNPEGPPILFIHGYSQSLLSWKEQMNDPALQEKFRMVALDLRGHGASGKPWTSDSYSSEDWGGDIAHVMAEKEIDKPVLVGWSMGASVISAYVRHHGTEDISGIVFATGALSLTGRAQAPDPDNADVPPQVAEVMRSMMQMLSPNIAANLAGTSAFVDRLAAVPLPEDVMDEALIYNMMLPAYVRSAMSQNQTSYDDLAGKITVPTILIHGDADALVPFEVAVNNQPLLPNSELITYSGIGHAPFLEDPQRFNADVAEFVSELADD